MKTIIHLPLPSHAKVLVEEGDSVKRGAALADVTLHEKELRIPLASLLSIPNAHVPKYLRVVSGEVIAEGQIIAMKKGLFSSASVKSPTAGTMKDLDLRDGTLTLVTGATKSKETIMAALSGKVVAVEKHAISLEVDGVVHKGLKSYGDDVWGRLAVCKEEVADIFDITGQMNDAVVAALAFSPEAITKMDVIGSVGLLSVKVPETKALPWMVVTDDEFAKISKHEGNTVWLRMKEKQLVILS